MAGVKRRSERLRPGRPAARPSARADVGARVAAKVGKRGVVVLPAPMRRRFGLDEGSMVVAEAREDGILIRPARLLPQVEVYTPERIVEFLLSNAFGHGPPGRPGGPRSSSACWRGLRAIFYPAARAHAPASSAEAARLQPVRSARRRRNSRTRSIASRVSASISPAMRSIGTPPTSRTPAVRGAWSEPLAKASPRRARLS